jgi:YesN/AraC family two-component response regulator
VKGKEKQARQRILHYCSTRKLDSEPYLKLLKLSPQLDPKDIPIYREFLRSLTALAKQCCVAAGTRAEDYKPHVIAIKYRPHDEMPYLVKEALRYVHGHLSEPFTVKGIATHLRCHPNFLSKQFKKHLHVELATYASQLRIGHATQIMGNPKLSISQVADESGFCDRVYFGKVFRRATGMTPGQYRQYLASLGRFPRSHPV